MERKELIRNTIERKAIDRIPLMYRGSPKTNEYLKKYFGLVNLVNEWVKLIEKLGADNFSNGATLGAFTTYFPKYIGPHFNAIYEPNHFFIWGIKPVKIEVAGDFEIVFHKDPPLYNYNDISDLKKYEFPKVDWFNFKNFIIVTEAINQEYNQQKEIKRENIKNTDDYFLNAYYLNSIFMTSIFLRGIDKMLMDLIVNKKYAEFLIAYIGEFMLNFCEKYLSSIGERIDLYGIWDDFASQDNLIISPELWRKFYKPWDKKIIEIAKRYSLYVCFHICGNCSEVIPDLIEMGVDILDPVQVSAKNMELEKLKKQFGKHICFHGGLDAQKLIPLSTPEEIKKEVLKIKKLFRDSGGIILGPSHYITADTPIENVLSIY